MSIIQALAMTVAEIPVFVYTTFGQVQHAGKAFLPGSVGPLFGTCLCCEGQRHDGVMLGDLDSLKVCKNCMESLEWWERAAQGGLGEGGRRASHIPPQANDWVQPFLRQRH